MMTKGLAIFLSIALTACANAPSRSGLGSADDIATRMGPHRVASNAATSGALGSEKNPVRVYMPDGEREYLSRLRCKNGKQPTFERHGSGGFSPHLRIMDMYGVTCDGETQTIYMDMYHCVEDSAPLPGFEIVPEVGNREKDECN